MSMIVASYRQNEIFRNKSDMCFECSYLASWHAT